ncbi:MarR family winged helix-turn-helix transcriptional regulator [Streptococcus orisasini]|uniref:MarR family winged helix-turn-helix transcriptional regulator n=1 Tax=Streptococcus orisasini TaxID=1080071 RepID=UPI00070970C2|nr:helix-turn-helix domain-containing protein [Streptococcus orisasini]
MTAEQKDNKHYLRIFDQQMSLYEHYARKNGLQSKSLFILLWLYYSPRGITQKQIVEKTYSTKQVVNASLKRWREKDYITFLESQTDHREKKMILSPKGQKYAKSIIDPLEKIEEAAFNSLSVQKQKAMIQLTDHYYQALLAHMQYYFVQKEAEKTTKEKP